jgi:hypothetical protein
LTFRRGGTVGLSLQYTCYYGADKEEEQKQSHFGELMKTSLARTTAIDIMAPRAPPMCCSLT